MQLSALTLKLNENNNKIDDLIGVDKNIKKDISSNKNLITANTSSISSNKGLIDTNTSSVSSISQFILKSDKDFEKTYNIESQRFEFNRNTHFFNILEKEIEHDFIKNSLLFIKNNIYYKYDDLLNDYYRCQHEYNIYDDNNNLIHKYLFNKDTYYNENSNILNTNEEFCIFLKQNYNKIKIVLELHRHNRHGFGNINLKIDNNNNYIKVDYIEKGFLDNSHLTKLNTESISTNTSDISDNLGKINTNTSSISSNLGLIETNTSSISDNKGLIETNASNISTNFDKIGINTGSIASNLEKINDIENNLIVFDNIYNETLTIGNFTSISNTIIFFYETINFNFTTNGIIKIDAKYTYFKNYNLTHIYKFYNNKKIFKEIKLDNISDIVNDKFEIQAINSTAIDIGIFYETNTGGNKEIKLVGDNTCRVSYFDNTPKTNKNKLDIASNLEKIDGNINAIKLINKNSRDNSKDISTNKGLISTNKSDISINLIKINSNEDDILYNLNEINNIKNNSSKSYLKNVYNILFYDKKTQVSFRNYFFEKVCDVNASINDFIEMSFKISLEYENISERSYVKTLYELFDENDNSLYIKSVSNNDYSYYSNKIFIDESIFYNFNKSIKKIKFVIKFQMILSRVIKIFYIKNNNYRFILKHYST